MLDHSAMSGKSAMEDEDIGQRMSRMNLVGAKEAQSIDEGVQFAHK